MRFTVVTILPELIEPSLTAGVVGRAREAGVITVDTVNPRDFTRDRHRTVDDTPYGGGPGMVMKAEPLLAAIAKASEPLPTAGQGPDGVPTAPRTMTREGHASAIDPDDRSAPLRKVEAAIAKVQSMLGGLVGDAGPLTSSQIHDSSTDVADAEAALAEVERELKQEALDVALTPSDIDTKPIAMIKEDDVDLRLPSHSTRRGALGPADEVPASGAGTAGAGDAVAGEEHHDEMPNLVERHNIVVTPPVGVPIVAPPVDGPQTSPPPVAAPSTSATSPPTTAAPHTTRRATPHRILLSPSGTPLTQARVRELAKLDHLVLVCGRYEGVDQRVIELAIDEELSIGDYVLSGGELGALVIIDAVARLVPGVLGEPTSADDESFSAGLLEYPQYTKPAEITMPSALQSDRIASAVPPVLQSGNHAAIAAWRRQQAMQRTAGRRPDLMRAYRASKADDKLFAPLHARTHVALVHHPVVDRTGAVVTTALTNFDIHDLARSSMAFGLAGYHIVTPIASQREKAEHIAKLWMEDEQGEHRAAALRLVRTAESIEAVIADLSAEHGRAPLVVATSARADSFPAAARRTSSELLAEASLAPAPLLLLLGTGWGLADTLIPSVSRVLAPIEGASVWNHLSVRSAGAVILDRLFGRPA